MNANRIGCYLQIALFALGLVCSLLSGDALVIGANAGLSLLLLTKE
jgi:hypothetical protein